MRFFNILCAVQRGIAIFNGQEPLKMKDPGRFCFFCALFRFRGGHNAPAG
uniref:Uncharacterized protein n=1 Tax=Candidatus Kentrum sp. DK TaxID=2126562 RepID=A0A450SXJ4_9GAMM|nr:MAG: hypothetical protein BECKDK2373B_GA0170837_107710 [Candidatus Kentron sp. DK]